MTPITTPPTRCTLAVLTIAIALLALIAPNATAADTALTLPAVLPALDMMEIVHDRARLIQFSVVAVALGIAMLWWGNKTN